MTRTTCTLALNASQELITLGSVTGVTQQMLIKIGDEFFRPVADADANALTVKCQRGANGSRAVTHGAAEPAYFGTPDEFGQTGQVYNTRFGNGLVAQTIIPTSQIATAGAVTYSAGHIKSGHIQRDTNGSGRTDTLPTAALLAAAFPGIGLDNVIEFIIENQADAAETITVAVGTGGTAATNHTLTIAQNNSKKFAIRFTNIVAGSEAYTLYNRGTFTT